MPPKDGESWSGYTHRVAAYYGTPWPMLMRPIIPDDPLRLRFPTSPHLAGVAATPPTIAAFAHYFRLTPGEVADMHLTRFNGSALSFTPPDITAHDPRHPIPAGSPRRGQRLGQLVSPRRPRACPECLRRRPRHQALTWRLRWHYACLLHGLLITDQSTRAHIRAPRTSLQTQEEILSRLTPAPENRSYFTTLDRSISATLRDRGHRAWIYTDSMVIANVAPTAARDPLGDEPKTIDPITVLRAGPATPSLDPALVPPLLPRRHFVPDLADLLYPVPIRVGREIASCAVAVRAAGLSPKEAAAVLHQRPRTPRRLHATLNDLARHGRLEPFVDAVEAAITALDTDHIDYRARAHQITDPDQRHTLRHAALRADPTADPWIIKSWLVEHWACTYTAGHERVTSRDGRLDDYDRHHGPALTSGLQTTRARAA